MGPSESFLRGATLKEITTGLIAVGIIVLNILMFYYVINSGIFYNHDNIMTLVNGTAANQAKLDVISRIGDAQFDKLKEVLLLATGFLGVILGYYFGRVPAEKAQETAEKHATDAQSKADEATKDAAAAKEQLSRVQDEKDEALKRVAGKVEKIDQHWKAVQGGMGKAPAKSSPGMEITQLGVAIDEAKAFLQVKQS